MTRFSGPTTACVVLGLSLAAAPVPCAAQSTTAQQGQVPSGGTSIPRSGVINPGATGVDPGMQVKPPATTGTMKVIKPKVPTPEPHDATRTVPRKRGTT